MSVGLELSNEGRVVLWRSIERDILTVGASPECDLCIPLEGVAPVQFLLRREDNKLLLANRSEGGTAVAGERVTGELPLANGDVIPLGPMSAKVCFRTVERAGGGTQTLHQQAKPTGATLRVTAAAHPGKEWELTARGLTAGGDPSNDIVIEDPYVSSFHAQLSLQAGRCVVRDLDSRNGVFVGGQMLKEGEVAPGSVVRLGQAELKIESPGAAGSGGQQTSEPEKLVGTSPAVVRMRELIDRIAAHDAPVLVTGETGTGKEVAARLLHEQSPRAAARCVALNCGALGRNLIESELFGHEKGAFTGATAQKPGAFELADGGTLFLDEIGELPLELQPQLLRAVENGEVRRLGASDTLKVDVRLIAATNRKLEKEVMEGRFREDLYHRLHVLTLDLPPLRERMQDVDLLTEHFMVSFSPDGAPVAVTDAAKEKLRAHDWPGNVRELRNVLQRAVLLRAGTDVDAGDVTFMPRTTLESVAQSHQALSGRTLAEIERDAIVRELRRHDGNKTLAADALGVSRSTIHRRMEDYGIDLDEL